MKKILIPLISAIAIGAACFAGCTNDGQTSDVKVDKVPDDPARNVRTDDGATETPETPSVAPDFNFVPHKPPKHRNAPKPRKPVQPDGNNGSTARTYEEADEEGNENDGHCPPHCENGRKTRRNSPKPKPMPSPCEPNN